MNDPKALAKRIRSMFVIHSFNGVPRKVEIEIHRIEAALREYGEAMAKAQFVGDKEHYEEEIKQARAQSRAEALEEAARVCENSVKWFVSSNINECTRTPTELAADIRARAQKKGE